MVHDLFTAEGHIFADQYESASLFADGNELDSRPWILRHLFDKISHDEDFYDLTYVSRRNDYLKSFKHSS